jgi:hypothetical protein
MISDVIYSLVERCYERSNVQPIIFISPYNLSKLRQELEVNRRFESPSVVKGLVDFKWKCGRGDIDFRLVSDRHNDFIFVGTEDEFFIDNVFEQQVLRDR